MRAVINMYGVSTFKGPLLGVCERSVRNLLDDQNCSDASRDAASGAYQVTASSPPTLTMHGTWDTIAPFAMSELLHEKVEENGVDNLLIPCATFDHVPEYGFYGVPAMMQRYALERFMATKSLNA